MRTLIRNNDKVIENTDKMPLSKLKFNNAARSSPTQASRGTDTYIMPTVCLSSVSLSACEPTPLNFRSKMAWAMRQRPS
jgi:hypothetical protein